MTLLDTTAKAVLQCSYGIDAVINQPLEIDMSDEVEVGFVIEEDVPLVSSRAGGGRAGQSKYPFAQMEPGQSFLATGVKPGTIRSAIGAWMKAHKDEGFKFAVREMEDGVRIWRVK